MASVDVAGLLRATELFAGLDESVATQLGKSFTTRTFRKGQPLFHQGDPGDALYLVVDGSVAVFVVSEGGDRMVLSTLRPPDVLGEIALLDGGNRSASAEALEPTSVLTLSRSAFLEVIRTQPQLVEQLLRGLGGLVRRLSEQASDFVFLDLPGRVAKVLVRLAEDAGIASPDLPVEVAVTQGRLAEMVGGSRQSVNQILQSFQSRGLVEVQGRKLLLSRVDLLRKRAGLPD